MKQFDNTKTYLMTKYHPTLYKLRLNTYRINEYMVIVTAFPRIAA